MLYAVFWGLVFGILVCFSYVAVYRFLHPDDYLHDVCNVDTVIGYIVDDPRNFGQSHLDGDYDYLTYEYDFHGRKMYKSYSSLRDWTVKRDKPLGVKGTVACHSVFVLPASERILIDADTGKPLIAKPTPKRAGHVGFTGFMLGMAVCVLYIVAAVLMSI